VSSGQKLATLLKRLYEKRQGWLMLKAIRLLLWTGCCVGLGIALSTTHFDGKTPLEHMTRAWKTSPGPSKIEDLKNDVSDALEKAKDKLNDSHKPKEHHTDKDREAVNKLIAKKSTEK
jgi:hypothetical protein